MYLAAVLGHRPSVDHRKLLLLYLSASLFKLETTGGGSFSKFREKLKPVVTREPQGLELDSGNHVLAVCHTMPRARRRTSGNLRQVSNTRRSRADREWGVRGHGHVRSNGPQRGRLSAQRDGKLRSSQLPVRAL
jgi:hypothetical protein